MVPYLGGFLGPEKPEKKATIMLRIRVNAHTQTEYMATADSIIMIPAANNPMIALMIIEFLNHLF